MPNAATIIAELTADEAFQRHCLNTNFQQLADGWGGEIAASESSRTEIIHRAAEKVLALHAYASPEEIEGQWNQLREKRKYSRPILRKLPKRNQQALKWFVGLAASALLAVGLFQLIAPTATLLVTIATTDGELKTVELPDGSQVQLNANSQLQYAADWNSNDSKREVTLKGEGYFEVSKSSKPGQEKFSVLTDRGRVQVLGTIFNLRQRAEDIELLLLEGKVSLSVGDQEDVVILPGQQASLDEYDRLIIETLEDPEPLVAWLNQRLVIRAEPISRIQERLQEEFSLKLSVPNPGLRAKEVSATMSSNDPFALIEALAVLYDLNFEVSSDSLQITLTE